MVKWKYCICILEIFYSFGVLNFFIRVSLTYQKMCDCFGILTAIFLVFVLIKISCEQKEIRMVAI